MQTNLILKSEIKYIEKATKNYLNLGVLITEIYQNNDLNFYNTSFSIISSDREELTKYLDSNPFFKFYTKKEIIEPLDGQIYPINNFQTQKIKSKEHLDLYTTQNIPLRKIPLNPETNNFGIMLFNRENLTSWTNKSNALSPLIKVEQCRYNTNFYR
jgi:hypothetical protein